MLPVTDPTLLKVLLKTKLDPANVGFTQDYAVRELGKGHAPYAKFYRHKQLNLAWAVFSGLPMVDTNNDKIVPGWLFKGPGYVAKRNLFSAQALGRDVRLTCLSDQPDKRKKNDELAFSPRLFLNGIEKTSAGPLLLNVDPINPNYLQNTLEWDYGLCKRRLRIIEGRLRGSWIFPFDPGGDIRINYNQSGDFRLKLGPHAVGPDEELIPAKAFKEAKYPFEISDSSTFNPDAHEETASVDGDVGHAEILTWANLIAEEGTTFSDTSAQHTFVDWAIGGVEPSGSWAYMHRSIFLFDTSALPPNAIISAATFSVYGAYKVDPLGDFPGLKVYSSAPVSNTELAGGDFNSFGSTQFCDQPVTFPNFDVSDYNDFTLNAAGLAAISLTGVTKLGLRGWNYDTPPNAPSWANSKYTDLEGFYSDKGAGFKPKLVVTFSVPPPQGSIVPAMLKVLG
ncbi:hypothetical protein LCGC14_0781990 [marine sediment metagenome]|uniref:Uncharacterized protein n=1 Tax=marine sediment metagenome TaxID=412755 RepID=A0A0F9PZF6_9ZZZZ